MPEQNNKLLFCIIALLSCCIILLLIVTVKIFISNFTGTRYSNFANYNQLSQDKSLETLLRQSNRTDLLEWPAYKFYWNTSHNSYLSGGQILDGLNLSINGMVKELDIKGSTNSPNCVINALNYGARVLELDIYPMRYIKTEVSSANPIVAVFTALSGTIQHIQSSLVKDERPVVAHLSDGRVAFTNIVDLEGYFKAIKDNAFKYTNDPLILNLEFKGTQYEQYLQTFVNLVKQYFSDRLYQYTFSNEGRQTSDKYWKNVPIKNLLGKIIILVPWGNDVNLFDKYTAQVVHGILNNEDNIQTRNYDQKHDKDRTYWPKNEILFSRVYPYNIVKSSNFAPGDLWCYNHNALAMNFTINNGVENVQSTYLNKFKYSNIVPIYANVESLQKIVLPGRIRDCPLYEDTTIDIEYIKPNTCYRRVSWISENKKYELRMQGDGNLVIYNRSNNKSLWTSGTGTTKKVNNENSLLQMQGDGNLIVYHPNGKPLWSSGTGNKQQAFAYLNNKGQLVINYKDNDVKKFN